MKTDGIILDVDGTLWNSTGIVAKAWNKAVEKANVTIDTALTAEMLQKEFGKTMKVIADDLFPAESEQTKELLMDLCCQMEHEALREMNEDITYDNVIDTIKKLSEKVPVFIVSNCQKGYIELFMEKNAVKDYIKDTECYGNTGQNKGDNMRLLVERNGLRYPVYVGDTKGDQEASDFAGVPFIFASYGFGEADRYAAKINTFSELLNIEKMECARDAALGL